MIGEVDGEIILNNDKWRRVQEYRGQKPNRELLKRYKAIGGATAKAEPKPAKKAAKKTTKKVAKKTTKK